jgi:beta-aspartyl-peptidase (threonine type)
MERTEHVLIVNPGSGFTAGYGLEVADPGYFITEPRRRQLDRVLDGRRAAGAGRESSASRHGTVGAVARDAAGRIAAATSTGGMVGQDDGRVGDSPVVGAGVYARDEVVGVSCTGHGEAFIRGVIAHDIAARIRYAGADLASAVRGTFAEELDAHRAAVHAAAGDGAYAGGIIAVGGDGRVVVAHNSPAMFSARGTGPEPDLTT